MKKIHPDFEQEKVNMFEETELPAHLKGLIIDSIQKEKRKNIYKEITFAAAVLLILIIPSYFYLYHNDNNVKNNVAVNLKRSSDEGTKSNNAYLYPDKQDNSDKYSSNPKGFKDKAKYDSNANINNRKLVGNTPIKNIKQNKSSSNPEVRSKNNLNSIDKTKIKSKVNEGGKNNYYSNQTAINQSTDITEKSNNKLSAADSIRSDNSLANNDARQKILTDKSLKSDNQKKDYVISPAKTPDSDKVALVDTRKSKSVENTAKPDYDNNTIDNSNMKVTTNMCELKPVITINCDSNIDIQELEDIINEMNIKDYVVNDSQIEANCSISEYENIKNYFDKTYQDKINYTEPENLDENKNLQVKLIIQF